MPDNFLHIEIQGVNKLKRALEAFPRETERYLSAAGQEAADRMILTEQGLKRYPPATAANMPPTPFYIRGRGTQYKSRNLGNSERLGTRFYTRRIGANTEIGNTASYAKYVVGEKQAHWMAPIGWRKLREVAEEKIEQITKVYQAWVDKLLRDLGL